MMNHAGLIIALLLAVGVLSTALRSRTFRQRVLTVLAALALYFTLLPPSMTGRGDVLTVLSAGAERVARASRVSAPQVVLPGVAGELASVPDLATALRQYPAVTALHVVGDGLPARDREWVRRLGLSLTWQAPLPARGVQQLAASAYAVPGSLWRIAGRTAGDALQVELTDPAGAVVTRARPDGQGEFALSATLRGEGEFLFGLRLLDADGALVEALMLPVVVRREPPPRLLLLAGGPQPELKFLRRWATDAGLPLASRITLRDELALGELTLTPTELGQSDVLILDERSWASLSEQEQAAIIAAVEQGLGVLLRVTGPLPERVAEQWARLGFTVQAAPLPSALRLGAERAYDPRQLFTRRPITVRSDGAQVLLRSDQGEALALLRGHGQGRIGLWWLTDSYKLAQSGAASHFGALWAETIGALARPAGQARPELPAWAFAGERLTLTDVLPGASVLNPQGQSTALLVEAGQAGYWPRSAGWHQLRQGGESWPFYVQAADAARRLRAAADRAATEALIRPAHPAAPVSAVQQPLARGPFFGIFLALMTALWWLERWGVRAV